MMPDELVAHAKAEGDWQATPKYTGAREVASKVMEDSWCALSEGLRSLAIGKYGHEFVQTREYFRKKAEGQVAS